MSIIKTDLRNTRESARRIRFEPVGSLTATNVQGAIQQTSAQGGVPIPTSVGTTPYAVQPNDTVLYVNTAIGPVTINLPFASVRAGVPLSIKDVSGSGLANPISLVPAGAETVDGLAPYPITGDFAGVRLYPRSGSGYTVAP